MRRLDLVTYHRSDHGSREHITTSSTCLRMSFRIGWNQAKRAAEHLRFSPELRPRSELRPI